MSTESSIRVRFGKGNAAGRSWITYDSSRGGGWVGGCCTGVTWHIRTSIQFPALVGGGATYKYKVDEVPNSILVGEHF